MPQSRGEASATLPIIKDNAADNWNLTKIENLHKNVHTNGLADYPSIRFAHWGNSWYIERYDIELLDRVQGGSYAFSNHIQVDVLLNTGYA